MAKNKFSKNRFRMKKRYIAIAIVCVTLCTFIKHLSDNRIFPTGYPTSMQVTNSTITANYVDDKYLSSDPSYPRVVEYTDYSGNKIKATCANPWIECEHEDEFKSILSVKFKSFKTEEEKYWVYAIY